MKRHITVKINGELYLFKPRKNGKCYVTIGKGKNQETIRGSISALVH